MSTDKEHPLHKLSKPGEVIDMIKTLQPIPMERTEETGSFIREKI